MCLTRGQNESQWIAQDIDADMDFSTETATASTQSLFRLTSGFSKPNCIRMNVHDGVVQNQVFPIWVIGKMMLHFLPDTLVTPAGEAFVDAVLVPIFLW